MKPMLNFIFHNPTKVFFGRDTIRQMAGEIPKDSRVMITFGGGSARQNGALDEVQTALQGTTSLGLAESNPTRNMKRSSKAQESPVKRTSIIW